MSLATSYGGISGGAGMGAGGMAMSAHTTNAAMAKHMGNQGPSSNTTGTGGTTSTTGFVPPRVAADLKKNGLSHKMISNTKNLPIVCVDLYGDGDGVGDGGEVSFVPPEKEMIRAGRVFTVVRHVGPVETSLRLKRHDEVAYKAVRKWLGYTDTTGEGLYHKVLTSAMCSGSDGSKSENKDGKGTDNNDESSTVVTLPRPHLLLGSRRLSQVRGSLLSKFPYSEDDEDDNKNSNINTTNTAAAAAIRPFGERETALLSQRGVVIFNSSLGEWSGHDDDDDLDRVGFRLDLLPRRKKKPLTVLPEEAVALVLARACFEVSRDAGLERAAANSAAAAEEPYLDYPVALAVPGWHLGDAAVEAHLEAATSPGTLVYHRAVAAVVGALWSPTPTKPPAGKSQAPNKLLQLLHQTGKDLQKQWEQEQTRRGADVGAEMAEDRFPLVLAIGATSEGVEGVACQLRDWQEALYAPLSKVKVISEASRLSSTNNTVTEDIKWVLDYLLDTGVPNALPEDNRIPLCLLTYGTTSTQESLKKLLLRELQGRVTRGDDDRVVVFGAGAVPVLSTKPEAVATGLAVLAARAYQRTKCDDIVLDVQGVNACAVGIELTYGNGQQERKVVFDFDRRVPAGPYDLELSAAACAAKRAGNEDEGVFGGGGSKNIKKREEAALALKMQVVQQLERDGEWIKVGNESSPLVMGTEEDEEGGGGGEGENVKTTTRTAIETCTFSISVNTAGQLSIRLTSDNKSITQALTSKRWSTLRYVLWVLFLVCFLGGFFVKSYVEDKVFARDVAKLLAYYEHVTPHSMHAGDKQRARYLVYKYRNKKHKLWKNLELKYGVAVQDEWDDEEEEEEVEVMDMDEEEEDKEQEL